MTESGWSERRPGALTMAVAASEAAVGRAGTAGALPIGAALGRLGERLERSLGITLRGQALIAAVALAVVVVTLGQLQAFAVQANERDAVALLARLGPAVEAAWAERVDPSASDPTRLSVWTAGAGLERLGDVGWLEDGRRLRRHGYLFAMEPATDASPFLVAWPWEHGRSGRAAFAWSATAGVLEHPNPTGHLTGPSAWPTATTPGWRRSDR